MPRPTKHKSGTVPVFRAPRSGRRKRECPLRGARRRRGVLLLVVLAFLALFGLVVTTYLVVTSHAYRAAKVEQTQDTDPIANTADEAILQVIRGHNGAGHSVLETHSLLEGLYGNALATGEMRHTPGQPVIAGPPFSDSAPFSKVGELIYFYHNATSGENDVTRLVGCVLTMLSGPAAGKSTRIVGCQPGANGILQVLGFEGTNTTQQVVGMLQDNVTLRYEYLINGTPFSGMGRSYNPATGRLNFTAALNPSTGTWSGEGALLPNTAFQPATAANLILRAVPGWANVDYTAPDYNTLLPAMAVCDPNVAAANPALPYGSVITPSLHRQELVRYWINRVNPGATDLTTLKQRFVNKPNSDWTDTEWRAFKRRLVLRPLLEDHPNFTGSNPKHNAALGPYESGFNPLWDRAVDQGDPWYDRFGYDVDNDGDGVPDSIWVDLGFPVVTLSDGRRAKPLVAILCQDLDGRLNLNAHGSLAHAYGYPLPKDPLNPGSANNNYYYYDSTHSHDNNNQGPSLTDMNAQLAGAGLSLRFADATGNGTENVPLLRGQGWGPADISLRPLWPSTITSPTEMAALLLARDWDSVETGGIKAQPGVYGVQDALSQNKLFNYWNDAASVYYGAPPGTVYDWWTFLTNPAGHRGNAYGTPPAFKGGGAVGLDLRGAPIYALMGWRSQDGTKNNYAEQTDNPYERDLSSAASGSTTPASPDKPYSLGELEPVVRPFDGDSAVLPARLTSVAQSLLRTSTAPGRRQEVTTESWDLPTPGIALPVPLQTRLMEPAHAGDLSAVISNGWYPARHIRDILAIKMRLDGATPQVITNSPARLLPYEMLAGLKMNLNRPFGNGLDDNNNGVVDEPGRVYYDPNKPNPNAPPPTKAGFVLDASYSGEILLGAVREQLLQVGGTLAPGANPYYNPLSVNFEHINGVDVNGDDVIDDADRAMARQLYARHLYILGLLVIDHTVANPNNPTAQESNRARMVAQWAVNVVDFCDRDSIMAPFEYDIAPFVRKSPSFGQVSWNVDGVVGTSDDTESYRGLVWGVERPELLIGEVLAFHDRRTQDLDADGGKVGGTPADDNVDFDQGFRPEGSLFVELYNPSTNLEPRTGEFYSAANGGIDLTKTAPNGAPVWRLAIYDTVANANADPDEPAPNPTTHAPERSVYFCNAASIPVTNDGYRHYTQDPPTANADKLLYPGRYAVIGSGRTNDLTSSTRTTTYLGFLSGQTTGNTNTRRIELFPYHSTNAAIPAVGVYQNKNGGNNDLDLYTIQDPIAIVIDKAGATPGVKSVRLSVSEPQGGYPEVDASSNPITADGEYQAPYPRPLDHFDEGGNSRTPNLWPTLSKDGTTPNFRVVHLQRLANPLLPWDAASNPYCTVDASPIDLVTFNGITGVPEPPPDGGDAPMAPSVFVTRERGGNPSGSDDNNLWEQEPLTAEPKNPRDSVPNLTGHVFQPGLSHTLGLLNWCLNQPVAQANLGPRDASAGNNYQGDPRGTPFPWITWNNRPFASPLELMLVPAASARRLLVQRAYDATTNPYAAGFGLKPGAADPYTKTSVQAGPAIDNDALFPHLLNFFWQNSGNDADLPPGKFHGLLEFVRVPSPFVGTETQFNPTTFARTDAGYGGTHIFPPPFHMVSTYREPGRINLNTIFSSDVWKGLLNRQDLLTSTGDGGILTEFQLSRQGYGTGASHVGMINPAYPTRFARPFRSSAGYYLVPPIPSTPPLGNSPTAIVNSAVSSTLLRRSEGATTRPLFSFENTINANTALLTNANDANRNPYFRYQQLMRLGNLTTNRSNVFAVWITVGLFEALLAPAAPTDPQALADHNAVYREGYTWGQEIGLDTGELKRHRSFYMIDRTIPVGFRRGGSQVLDENVRNTIVLRRSIE